MSVQTIVALVLVAKYPEFHDETDGRDKAWRFAKGEIPCFAIEQSKALTGVWIKPHSVKGEILKLRHFFRQFGMRADGNFAPNNESGRNSAVHGYFGSKDLVLVSVTNLDDLDTLLSEIVA